MGRLTSLVKETAIYGVSSILGRMLNWLLVPLYTQYLLPADYGIVTELYAYAAFLLILYTFGMETAYFRFTTKLKDQGTTVLNQAQSAIMLSSILFSVLLIIFATPITEYLEYPGKERYIVWFSIILAVDAVVTIPFAHLRLQKQAKKFAMVKLLNIGVNIGFNLFFIVFCTYIINHSPDSPIRSLIAGFYKEEDLVDYVFISNLIASTVLLIVFGQKLLKVRLILDKSLLREMFSYAFPIMIMSLAGVTNEMLSRAVLKRWLPSGFYPGLSNQAALGIFGAAYKLSVFMTLAIQAFRYAAEPFFFSRADDSDSLELFGKVMKWFILFGAFIFLVIVLNLDIIGFLFLRNEAYWDGLVVVPVLLLANLFLGVYYNLSVWFKLTDRTRYGTFISVGGAIITIALNYILIPVLGYMGSSIATLICYISMVTTSYLIGKRFYPVPYQVWRYLMYIAVSVALAYLGFSMPGEFTLHNKLYQMLLIVLFAIAIILLERKHLTKILKTRKDEHQDR